MTQYQTRKEYQSNESHQACAAAHSPVFEKRTSGLLSLRNSLGLSTSNAAGEAFALAFALVLGSHSPTCAAGSGSKIAATWPFGKSLQSLKTNLWQWVRRSIRIFCRLRPKFPKRVQNGSERDTGLYLMHKPPQCLGIAASRRRADLCPGNSV